jgi:hypothetical protein
MLEFDTPGGGADAGDGEPGIDIVAASAGATVATPAGGDKSDAMVIELLTPASAGDEVVSSFPMPLAMAARA